MEKEAVYVELTQDEIVKRIESEARNRLGMSARDMVRMFLNGRLEDPGDIIDLIGLASMLDTDHPLYVEP